MTKELSSRELNKVTYVSSNEFERKNKKRRNPEKIERFPAMSPNRQDTYKGVYLPAWLFTLGLDADAILTWGAMARTAGRKRRLHGFSHSRIAAITGISLTRTHRAVKALEDAGVLCALQRQGKASDYAFRGPQSDAVTWAEVRRTADGYDQWEEQA
jgi:hypothetical protein